MIFVSLTLQDIPDDDKEGEGSEEEEGYEENEDFLNPTFFEERVDPETQEKLYFEKAYPEPSEEEFLATRRKLAQRNPAFQPTVSTEPAVNLSEIPKEEVKKFFLSFCLFVLNILSQETFDLKKEKKVWKQVQPQLFLEEGEEPAQKKRKQE